ncbi:MAG: hypothetical protein LBN21_05985 [Treponema sp.]|nr:hypothetical protein [Treponema sp.]
MAAAVYSEGIGFRDFPWGTSIEEFTASLGAPVSKESYDGLTSLAYENIEVSGYMTFMLVYFSKSGLEGGTYYFLTKDYTELMNCYRSIQLGLMDKYGITALFDEILKEVRPYESAWNLADGYIHLKVNTRRNEPITLWYSSPSLTKKLLGT